MELSSRYSKHVNQTIVLVKAPLQVRAQLILTAEEGPAAFGHSATPAVGRAKLVPHDVATSHLDGSTVSELADLHDVSGSTIKRVLRDEGAKSVASSSLPALLARACPVRVVARGRRSLPGGRAW